MEDYVALDLIRDIVSDNPGTDPDDIRRIRDIVKDTGREVVVPDVEEYEEA